jgi:hypothetical protein
LFFWWFLRIFLAELSVRTVRSATSFRAPHETRVKAVTKYNILMLMECLRSLEEEIKGQDTILYINSNGICGF